MAKKKHEPQEPLDEPTASRPAASTAESWRGRNAWLWLAIVLTTAVTSIQLSLMGRLWWCECGQSNLWAGDVMSSHASQHLADPYAITHVLHGLIFYGILALIAARLPFMWRFWLAMAIECGWEILENTDFVINRYREGTASQDYFGDSIVNSIGDIVCCGFGFILARKLGLWGTIVLFVLSELVLLFWIRDNLFLNVLMLFFPIESLKTWQLNLG